MQLTPKEKANELVEKFSNASMQSECYNIQCAIIAVEEILYTMTWNQGVDDPTYVYWQEVKQELEKML